MYGVRLIFRTITGLRDDEPLPLVPALYLKGRLKASDAYSEEHLDATAELLLEVADKDLNTFFQEP